MRFEVECINKYHCFFLWEWLSFWPVPELFIFHKTLGFSRKKNVPRCWEYQLFEVDPTGSPVEFILTPWDFRFFCIDPLEIHVFSSTFGVPPWNSNDFYSTSLEFSIDIPLNFSLSFPGIFKAVLKQKNKYKKANFLSDSILNLKQL